jgi:hypothetical protein
MSYFRYECEVEQRIQERGQRLECAAKEAFSCGKLSLVIFHNSIFKQN